MIYQRKIKSSITAQLSNDHIIAITGMRRVGKTYLLSDLYQGIQSKNKAIIDLEKSENRKLFEDPSYDAIIRGISVLHGVTLMAKSPGETPLEENRAYLFIDEIQHVKNIPSVLKYLTDHFHLKCIATGSSSYYIKNLFTESLSGRKCIYTLWPLDFGEYLLFQGVNGIPQAPDIESLASYNTSAISSVFEPFYRSYLSSGGFPQVARIQSKQERDSILSDILQSYVQLDVKSLSDIKKTAELERLISLMPPRVGQKLDITRISMEIGISRPTVSNYVSFLADTFLLRLIQPYSASVDRVISGKPKVFLADSQIIGSEKISEGQLLEQTVLSGLYPWNTIQYYAKNTGAEIDFILNEQTAIEVKVFATPRDYARTAALANKLGITSAWCITLRQQETRHDRILPAYLTGFLCKNIA